MNLLKKRLIGYIQIGVFKCPVTSSARHLTIFKQHQNGRHEKQESQQIHTMQGMNMLTLKEFNEQQIEELLWTAIDMKEVIKAKRSTELCQILNGNLRYFLNNFILRRNIINIFIGQSLAAIFQKRSTRTRFAFEAGAHCLGAHAIFCNKEDIHLGVSESVKDTTLVLSRLSNLIAARVYEHSMLEEMAKYSKVPIINALSDEHHPTQALADLMTIYEHFGRLKGLIINNYLCFYLYNLENNLTKKIKK